MRLTPFVLAAVAVLLPKVATAQEWIEYVSRQDFFSVNFPGQPTIETITYESAQGAPLPGRVYTASTGSSKFSVTVVDYSRIEEIQQELVKKCPPDVHMTCRGTGPDGPSGSGYSKLDAAGAYDWATWKVIQRGSKITQFQWTFVDYIMGRWIQSTNADGSRTYDAIHMHDNRLYWLTATVPKGYPEPGLFHQSLHIIDEKGAVIRYNGLYMHGYPKPTRAGQGGGAAAPAAPAPAR
jgi:hypothetical protein